MVNRSDLRVFCVSAKASDGEWGTEETQNRFRCLSWRDTTNPAEHRKQLIIRLGGMFERQLSLA